jgi:hypothetical protein
MRIVTILCLLFLFQFDSEAQGRNEKFSNPEVLSVLKGDFDPADYTQANPVSAPKDILEDMVNTVSPDTLYSFLKILATFENRNTGADTLSPVRGMGAARNWCLDKMNEFDAIHEDRMETGFFIFDQEVCGMERHKNVLSVLPGQGPNRKDVVLVLAHLDSRCDDRCDTDCIAAGIEDNGSGSALVLELARTMGRYTFDRTMAFMLTTGEEQGLVGARAFADYCRANDINIYVAYNNDIVGGIICGSTASPPGCPGLNHIDSINVRVYSQGGTNSKYKMLARFLEQSYNDHLAPIMPVKNVINIMSPEDRTGRGGDHIPFRENRFPTVRFCAANEHGDGNPSQPGYDDRQHTHDDILGVDTDNDGVLDSFFIDFNYLARNTLINGGSMVSASVAPAPIADFTLEAIPGGFIYELEDTVGFNEYRIGVRRLSRNTFDTTFFTTNTRDTVYIDDPFIYYVNVATVDDNGMQSLYCQEESVRIRVSTEDIIEEKPVELMQNYPNPFDEATTIAVVVNRTFSYDKAEIRVMDTKGKVLSILPITLNEGDNEVLYSYADHGFQPGAYYYSLWIDGKMIETKMMIYAF